MKLLIKEIDKANHFVVGTLLFCFFALFIDPVFSYFMVYLIAFFKEYFDDQPDMIDTLYTVLGALPVFVLLMIKTV
jgi:hypothetical protein